MRQCNKCKQDKLETEFYRISGSDKLRTICKACIIQRSISYEQANQEKVYQTRAIYRATHKEKFSALNKSYYARNKNKVNSRMKANRQKPEIKAREKEQNKLRQRIYRANPTKKILDACRRRVNHAISKHFANKSAHTIDLIGCSPSELVLHLEKQFKQGMNWQNHGLHGWHIDHIKPCSSFDLTNPEQQKICFHYSNLQPLWWHENLSKSNK